MMLTHLRTTAATAATYLALTLSLVVVGCSSASEPAHTDTTVTKGVLREPMVRPASATMNIGESLQLTVTGDSPADKFTWWSADTAVATVSQAGVVTTRKVGATTIVAALASDPTVRAAALVSVASGGPASFIAITSITTVPGDVPAPLNNLSGAVAARLTLGGAPSGATETVSLVVHRETGDTVVASAAGSTSGDGVWPGTFVWNTNARSANGTPVFPNGAYQLYARALIGNQLVAGVSLNVTVVNP